jgi:serine O-acetyltransferase
MLQRIKKFLQIKYWRFNHIKYHEMISYDVEFNTSFRGKEFQTLKDCLRHYPYETRAVIIYRKYQANIGNFWGIYYGKKLDRFCLRTGIDFAWNPNIGKGLLIGHWGRIVLNGEAKFGDEIMLTHNITIGRDIRGKRVGVPTFGDKICIRTNSTVVGNITIGDDVLIAPNTFVNFDVPSHSVVIGNPATIHHKENATEGHLGRLK